MRGYLVINQLVGWLYRASPEFWHQFWPELLATLIGAAVGVPIGLWLNRRGLRASEARARAERDTHHKAILHAVRQTVGHNIGQLQKGLNAAKKGDPHFDMELTTTAWDSFGAELSGRLRDPRLQIRLAYFFERLAVITRLNQKLHLSTLKGLEHSRAHAAIYELATQLMRKVHDEDGGLLMEWSEYEMGPEMAWEDWARKKGRIKAATE